MEQKTNKQKQDNCSMCWATKPFEADNNICNKCIKEQATALFGKLEGGSK